MAFPNPAKEVINFLFHPEEAVAIKIDLYSLNGERVSSINASLPAGRGQVIKWDCSGVSSGLYIAKIKADGEVIEVLKVCVQ